MHKSNYQPSRVLIFIFRVSLLHVIAYTDKKLNKTPPLHLEIDDGTRN